HPGLTPWAFLTRPFRPSSRTVTTNFVIMASITIHLLHATSLCREIGDSQPISPWLGLLPLENEVVAARVEPQLRCRPNGCAPAESHEQVIAAKRPTLDPSQETPGGGAACD